MFVERIEFGYAKCLRPIYVAPRTTIVSGSRGSSQLNQGAQVWGLKVHPVIGQYVDGIRDVPGTMAQRLDALEVTRKELEERIRGLVAEEMKILELAYDSGDLVTAGEIRDLANASAERGAAS